MQSRIFLLLLALVCGAQAQESESEGMKRILHPTLNPATDLQGKTFYGGADKGFSSKASNVKSFQWASVFRLKSYGGSKNFQSTKYWAGDYAGSGMKARTKGDYSIPKADEKYSVKTNAVREDRDAGKVQGTNDWANNRPYLVPGKAQKALDSQQEAKTPLTVDDVRKLLNTTR